ncbi:hypothetical protein [Dyadobacter sp.]|uniref:hypothetical protein n=1 Tax=Dyadobacter sp. TaxID=1914288 RepID=UPI003F707EF1
MARKLKNIKSLPLVCSVLVWLLCAWVQTQPKPVKTPASKAKKMVSKGATVVGTKPKRQSVAKQNSAVARPDTIRNPNRVLVDSESGLAVGENMFLVKAQCTICHSSKLILQSQFDRDKWIERIRWMQRTQKLWDLGETEKPILDYLVEHYGPVKSGFDGRRLPLPQQSWYKL